MDVLNIAIRETGQENVVNLCVGTFDGSARTGSARVITAFKCKDGHWSSILVDRATQQMTIICDNGKPEVRLGSSVGAHINIVCKLTAASCTNVEDIERS